MHLSIRQLENTEFPHWDSFVKDHPHGTIFHTTKWLRLISEKEMADVYAVLKDKLIVGGIALTKTKKRGIAGYHIPPLTQYFGPLIQSTSSSLSQEHKAIKGLLKALPRSKHYDFKLPYGHHTILPYHWAGFESSVSVTHIVMGSLEEYLKNLNKNKYRELKKLLKLVESGEISISNEANHQDILELLKSTSERNQFNIKPDLVTKLYHDSDLSYVKKIIISSKKHGIISIGLFPYDNQNVYNLINASVRVDDPVLKTINLLTIYKAIEFALTTGRKFDFEGSMLPGVETFCRLMGGQQVPVYRVQKSPSLRYSLMRAVNQMMNDRKKA